MPCNPEDIQTGACDNCTCNKSSQQPQSFQISKKLRSTESTPLLWNTTSISASTSTSNQDQESQNEVPKKCEHLVRPTQVCCRDLKKDDRQLIDPDIIRDCIIGLSDGLTVSSLDRFPSESDWAGTEEQK